MHLSSIQLVEERPLEWGKFNLEEIEKSRNLFGTLEVPSIIYSLALSDKFLIPIRIKVSYEIFTNSWVIDSSTTYHMTHSSHQFNNYNPCPNCRKIATIDSSLTTITSVGDIQISLILTFRNVFHVPKLSTNLVSIQKLTKDVGCDVIFYPTYYVF